MEAQKKEKPDSTLTSAVRDSNVDKGAEGPSLAQNNQGDKTPKEKREEDAQKQEEQQEQKQEQEEQKQKRQLEMQQDWF